MALFDRSASRVAGPLACYSAGFAAELAALGYSTNSVYAHLRVMCVLSAWMSGQGLEAGDLSPGVAGQFAPVLRVFQRHLKSAKALAPLMRYLRGLGVLPEPDAVQAGERDALVLAYQRYLRVDRGLSEKTVTTYVPYAAAFLDGAGEPLHEALAGLTGPGVLGILEQQLRAKPKRGRKRRSARLRHPGGAGGPVAAALPARQGPGAAGSNAGHPRGWPGGGWPGCRPGWTPRR